MYETDHQTRKCCCDCGTRIVIDEQLLEQRQMWKQKYLCLQRQMTKDIGQMKQTIYTECSTLMQTQFQNKEKQHTKLINRKNSEIQQLTSKLISLETTIKVMNREKEIENQKIQEFQDQIKEKDRLINMLKTQSLKSQHDWQGKMEEDMNIFRRKLLAQNKEMIESIETQNEHLKHKLRDFEKKYQILIPEVERLKAALNEKSSGFESLQEKYERSKRDNDKSMGFLTLQKEQVQKTHSKCRAEIIRQNDKINQLQIQIRNQKKAKNQVRVEPIYIQKPVHVQKIVQKIVSVEKVIKEYIEPQQYRDEALEHEYNKLKIQNDRNLKENNGLERKFQSTVKDYQNVIQEYQANINKYKTEREALAKKIQELNKELDIVYTVKRVDTYQRQQQQPAEPQKIKLYVKNDGISEYYSTGTTIPRIMTINSPRTLERQNQRNTSRNKPLSTSQSSKRVMWK